MSPRDQQRLYGVVLAGGNACRLGGTDKALLEVGGVALLNRVVTALRSAGEVIVVGPRRAAITGVRWLREEPPGSGPVAGLAAALDAIPDDDGLAAILAADLAGVSFSTVDKLVNAVGGADGALLVDRQGRPQWLVGAWRMAALRAVIPPVSCGESLRHTLGTLSFVEVSAEQDEVADVDTLADLEQARMRYREK